MRKCHHPLPDKKTAVHCPADRPTLGEVTLSLYTLVLVYYNLPAVSTLPRCPLTTWISRLAIYQPRTEKQKKKEKKRKEKKGREEIRHPVLDLAGGFACHSPVTVTLFELTFKVLGYFDCLDYRVLFICCCV